MCIGAEIGPVTVPPYSTSASLYDDMVGRYAFEHWRENFERLRSRYGLDVSIVADVACGTGLAAAHLAHMGALVFASDLSEHMLREAAKKNPGRLIRYAKQDMRYLQPPWRVNLVNCATDAMNHLLREDDFRRALVSARAALRAGGAAIFDMNSAWQLREGSDDPVWEFEVEGRRMSWTSAWDEGTMTSTLTMVFRDAGGSGEDVVEVHRERAYETGWVLEQLAHAGFSGAEAIDAAGLGKPSARTRRLLFVAFA